MPGVPVPDFEDQAETSPANNFSAVPPTQPEVPPSSAAHQEEPGAELDAALQAIVQKAQYATNANGAALALRQGSDVVCRAASGSTAPDRGARLQIKTGLTAECLRSGEVLRCDNAMSDSRVDLESCKRLGIEAIIITPIHEGKKLVGVLELFAAHAYSFQERDVEVVKGAAQEIGNLLAGKPASEPEPTAPAAESIAAEPVAAEPAVAEPAAAGQALCSGCGVAIASDAVFCPVCGNFQEAERAVPVPAAGWKANLSGRRLLVPAVFVAMALAVAFAPIPRHSAPVSKPVVQTAAASLPPAPVARNAPAQTAPAQTAPKAPVASPAAKSDSPAANNPNLAGSVKQILGGVSSDFSKLLPVNEKAEPPSNGDPNLRVWVDTKKGYYYCPGEEQYGHTSRGSFMTQKEAESNYYIPALVKPCM